MLRTAKLGLIALLGACAAQQSPEGASEDASEDAREGGQIEEVCLEDCGAALEPLDWSVADDERFLASIDSEKSGDSVEVYFGDDTAPGELSSVIGLTQSAQGEVRCSGVLVAPQLVLTARHCLGSITHAHVGTNAPSAAPIALATGAANRETATVLLDETPVPLDLALIKLAQAAPADAAPIRIAAVGEIDSASQMRIAGYGMTHVGESGRKKKADVRIVSLKCAEANSAGTPDSELYNCRPGVEIVAGGRPGAPIEEGSGADTCRGDSGGGAFVAVGAAATTSGFREALNDGRFALGAITSRTVQRSPAFLQAAAGNQRPEAICGKGGVYVRLDGPVLLWLQQAAGRLGGTITLAQTEATQPTEN